MINRIFLALLALVACGAAIAQQTFCKEYQASYWVFETSWMSSPAAACSALAGKSQKMGDTTYTISSAALNGQGHCLLKVRSVYPQPTPPATSDESAAMADRTKQGPCGQEQCQSQIGKETIVNWTIGYTRTSDIDVDPNWTVVGSPTPLPANKLICDPVQPCMLAAGVGVIPRQSESPTSSGLYRLSLDIKATYTGESCTPTDADKASLGKDAPIPPCPGFVGEINGKPGCYGTADNPTRNDKPSPKPMPPQAGNPAAGQQPSSGPGSPTGGLSSTPATGNGGPAGGPAAAAGSDPGTDEGDGTTDKPDDGKEQQNCGAPGQPKCRIDETGTPDGKGIFDVHRDKLENESQKMTDELEKIKGTGDKDTSWGASLSWISHGACTPWSLGTFSIMGRAIALNVDICPIIPWVVGVMNFLWAVGTFFAVVSMVFRVTTASSS